MPTELPLRPSEYRTRREGLAIRANGELEWADRQGDPPIRFHDSCHVTPSLTGKLDAEGA